MKKAIIEDNMPLYDALENRLKYEKENLLSYAERGEKERKSAKLEKTPNVWKLYVYFPSRQLCRSWTCKRYSFSFSRWYKFWQSCLCYWRCAYSLMPKEADFAKIGEKLTNASSKPLMTKLLLAYLWPVLLASRHGSSCRSGHAKPKKWEKLLLKKIQANLAQRMVPQAEPRVELPQDKKHKNKQKSRKSGFFVLD